MSLYEKMRRQLEKRFDENLTQSPTNSKFDSNRISTPVKSQAQVKKESSIFKNISEMNPNSNSTVGVKTQPKMIAAPSASSSLIGNPAVEKQIAELFVSFKNERSVYLVISKKHSENNWSFQEVKATIDRLIRIGIKKVLKYWKHYTTIHSSYPPFNLTENFVNKLLLLPIAQTLRVSMVQCLMEKVLSAERTF